MSDSTVDQTQELIDNLRDQVMAVRESGTGFMLISADSTGDAIRVTDLLVSTLQDAFGPLTQLIQFDLFEDEDDERPEVEGDVDSARTRLNSLLSTMLQTDVLFLHGLERNDEESVYLLEESTLIPDSERPLIVAVTGGQLVDKIKTNAPAFWERTKDQLALVPKLGILPRLRARYESVVRQLDANSPLREALAALKEFLIVTSSNLDKLRHAMSQDPKWVKPIKLIEKLLPTASQAQQEIDGVLQGVQQVDSIQMDRWHEPEQMTLVDGTIRRAIRRIVSLFPLLRKSDAALEPLNPIAALLNKLLKREESLIHDYRKQVRQLTHLLLQVVLTAVEVGSVSSNKTMIAKTISYVSGRNWDWNGVAQKIRQDTVLVGRLVGAANNKLREDSEREGGDVTDYALSNALKILGENGLRVFLTHQHNAVRLELSPAFRPIFDAIYLQAYYTMQGMETLLGKIGDNKLTAELPLAYLEAIAKFHDIGIIFLVEYVAHFLAEDVGTAPRDRHPYFALLNRTYPRSERSGDDIEHPDTLMDREREWFGQDHSHVGLEVIRKLDWNEDDPLLWIIRYHQNAAVRPVSTHGQPEVRVPQAEGIVAELDRTVMRRAAYGMYLLVLVNEMIYQLRLTQDPQRTAERMVEFQESMQESETIDRRYLTVVQPIRDQLMRPTVMEEVCAKMAETLANARTALTEARRDYAGMGAR